MGNDGGRTCALRLEEPGEVSSYEPSRKRKELKKTIRGKITDLGELQGLDVTDDVGGRGGGHDGKRVGGMCDQMWSDYE